MTQKWNLQDIRPIENKRPVARPPQTVVTRPAPVLHDTPDDTETVVIEDGNKKKRSKLLWLLGLAVVIIGGALAISIAFAETTLTVKPEFRQPNVNAEFEAYPEPKEGMLAYTVMTLETTGEKQVKASGEKTVEEQAKGTIEIFKKTPGAQRLKTSTRFRSPQGLIFKTEESVVVPGAVEKDGVMVPGSIRVAVYAESIGEQYNLPKDTHFVVPGFEEGGDTELFEAVYAKNPEAFSGGFNGPQFIIDDAELNTARQALQIELRNNLLERIKNERPSGFVVFEGSYAFTYNQLPAVSYGDDLVTIKEQAVLQVPLFKASDLAAYIAGQTVPTYNRAPVRIENYADMLFTYADPSHNATVIANLAVMKFTLAGKPLIIWEYDDKKLQADLAGKSKTALAQVITGYAGSIRSAQASIKPFYRRSFPDDGSKIKIIEEISE